VPIFLKPYNTTLIFDIDEVTGGFAAYNQVRAGGIEIQRNRISELDSCIGTKTADLKCYPGRVQDGFAAHNVIG
jgi:hypothetical protein